MNFSEIYGRYAADVHRFALYLCGNHSVAEDLASETFVHAMCGPTELRLGTVKAYLFAITRNLYRDQLARQLRMVSDEKMPEKRDPRPGPELNAQDRQNLANALRAMQRLPEQQREALLLVADQDLSYEDIARILGCSVAALKVRVHRARLALKAELKEASHAKHNA